MTKSNSSLLRLRPILMAVLSMIATLLGVIVTQAKPKEQWLLGLVIGGAVVTHGTIALFHEKRSVDEIRRTERAATKRIVEAISGIFSQTKALDECGKTVLKEVYDFFSDRGQIRVFFLQSCGDKINIQSSNSNKMQPAFESCWPIGAWDNISWIINKGEDSADIGQRMMSHSEPWRLPLIVDNINKADFQQGRHAVLQTPGFDGPPVISYCRAAVTQEDNKLGILCIDCWKPSALRYEDQEVIEKFAILLAATISIKGNTSPSPNMT